LIPGRGKRFVPIISRLVSGVHPTSCPMATGGSLPRSKVNLTTDLHLVPRVKTRGATAIILHMPAWCAQEYKIYKCHLGIEKLIQVI